MSRNQLKMIALVTMVIDHIGCRFVYIDLHPVLYYLMRGIGRISFPIFCFLLVQGMRYTRSRKRYLLQLAALGVVSEIPFDLFLFKTPFYPQFQNVCWTLAIGLGVIWLLDSIWKHAQLLADRLHHEAVPVLNLLVIGTGTGLAWLLRTDYSCWGVLLIITFYLLQEHFLLLAAGTVLICAGQDRLELAAAASLVLLYFYQPDLEQGKTKLPKMFFYLFYPAHLAVLWILRLTTGM